MKNLGRENGERFTGGRNGTIPGEMDLANGGATGLGSGDFGRRERTRGLGEASTGASVRGRANC